MEKEAMQPVGSTYEAYEAIVAALASPLLAEPLQTCRRDREARAGACDSEDEGFEARMLAFWDAAVTTPDLLDLLEKMSDGGAALQESMRGWSRCFARAHRGLFRVVRRPEGGSKPPRLTLEDVWSGAEFWLTPGPPPELALAVESAEGLIDGRLIGRPEPMSVALLPGAFFHPADATSAIETVVRAARERGLSKEDALDALLRMEARLRAHSRVKPGYAYRIESLTSR